MLDISENSQRKAMVCTSKEELEENCIKPTPSKKVELPQYGASTEIHEHIFICPFYFMDT
jgi:hypothetical protein